MAIVQLDALGAIIKIAYEGQANTNAYTNTEKTKLAGVADGATVNDTNANLRARSSHTGTQAMSTITGLEAALAAVSGGDFLPESYGGIEGTGLTGTERTANSTAFINCIAAADAVNGKVDLSGNWELNGVVTGSPTNIVIDGGGGKITQFADTVSVFAFSNAQKVTVRDLEIDYNTNQTTGGDPSATDTFHAGVRLTGINSFCNFINLKFAKNWVGIGMSGTNVGHKIDSTTSIVSASNSYGIVAKTGTIGCTYINNTITGNGSDISCSGAVLVLGGLENEFSQLRVDRLVSLRPIWLSGAKNINFENLTFNGVTPTAASTVAALVHLHNDSQASFENTLVTGTKLNKTTGLVDFANIFAGGPVGTGGGTVRAREMYISDTVETGVVRFGIIGSTTTGAALNTYGEFEGVRFDTATATPHRVDDICFATLDSTSTAKNGIVRRFNSTIGDACGGYVEWGDVSATIFTELHGLWQRFITPLTAGRTVTLSNRIAGTYGTGPLNSPLVPKGALMTVTRSSAASGAFTLTVNDIAGTAIGTLAVGQTGTYVYDGGAWTGVGRITF